MREPGTRSTALAARAGVALGEVARLVVPLRDQPSEIVIERAVLLHDHDDVVDRDVRPDRVFGPDGLRGPGPRVERARLALGSQLPLALGPRDGRRRENVGGVGACVVGARVGIL